MEVQQPANTSFIYLKEMRRRKRLLMLKAKVRDIILSSTKGSLRDMTNYKDGDESKMLSFNSTISIRRQQSVSKRV